MSDCCNDKACEVASLREGQAKVLWTVLAINAVMFVVEGYAGVAGRSTSLLADSLDMLGDALVYGFSIFVLTRDARWQARAALGKGVFMLVFGLAVLAEATYKLVVPVMPVVETMGLIGSIALVANLACFFLLYRFRAENLNMSSTWLCSRNDLIANLGVLSAALATYLMASRWPDVIVGVLIAALFLKSAISVIRAAMIELRAPAPLPVRGITIKTRRA